MKLPTQPEIVCTTVHALGHYLFCFSLWDLCICLDWKFVGFSFNYCATLPLPLDFVDSLVLWMYKSISVCLFVFNLFFSFHIWVKFSSVTQSCPTLCYPMECSTPGLPVHHQLLEFTQTHVHQVSDANQSSHSLSSSPSPPAFNLSQHQGFSNESALHIRWPKYWSFSFSISPSNEHSGLISFRMDWLDLLAVQATLKGLFQHHSSKASILQYSAFFRVQLSHPYLTTGKTIVLTIRSLWQGDVSAF